LLDDHTANANDRPIRIFFGRGHAPHAHVPRRWRSEQPHPARSLNFRVTVYNTLHGGGCGPRTPTTARTTVRRMEP
jgi:hypothetical protein